MTIIPVSYGAIVTAGRSNENAAARAQVHHAGVEMKLINVVIQEPPSEY